MSNQVSFHNRHEDLTDRIYSGELVLPHRYVFVLTNICNLACSFCFQIRDKRSDAMTKDDWINLIDQLPDYARVTFTGGEPLAFKEFEEVVSHAAKKHHCNMITNGLLLNEQKIDFLLSTENFKVLSVSIDDIGNKNRDVKPKHWDRFVEAIQYFHKRKKELGSQCVLDFKTVILDKNAHELFDIHKYCVETLGAETHAFQFLKGSPLQHADVMFDLERIYLPSNAVVYENYDVIWEQLELVRQYSQKTPCQTFVHPKIADLNGSDPVSADTILNKPHFEADNFKLCKFPWSSVHVNVDGHLFPCMAVSMGNVKEETLQDIVEGEKFREFKEILSSKLVEGCNRCGWIRHKENAAQ